MSFLSLLIQRPTRRGSFKSMGQPWFIGMALALALPIGTSTLWASVKVHQVESYYLTGTAYAPVNFNGNTTLAGTDTFSGITFHALVGLTSTESQHAKDVGNRYYGSGLAPDGHAAVSDVYADSYSNFLTNQVKTTGTLGVGAVPGYFGGTGSPLGIKVSNHSWVYTYLPSNPSLPNADEDAIRRIDFMTNRENVVLVAGAVTQDANSSGNFYNTNLVWSARNSLAVRGANANTPFSPDPNGPGKRHADVWASGLASYAAGTVSGYAAALVDHAQTLGLSDSNFNAAANNQVVRSLIMTGANKSVTEAPLAAWTRDTTNNLDIDLGAGKADYTVSKAILDAGRKQSVDVSAGTITAPTTYSTFQGWAYETSLVNGDKAIVFATSTTITSLTATLNWNVTQSQPNPNQINTSNAAMKFANLDLDLVQLTRVGLTDTYTVGSVMAQTGLTSHATDDNVEHLYYTGTDLTAGYYALIVRGNSSLATNYGLSFNTTSALLGDTNYDGVVDVTDYNNVQNNFGATGVGVLGDTNGDGVVDVTDYNNVQNNFGTMASTSLASTSGGVVGSAVPEPASLCLLAVGGMMMLGFRSRRRQA